MPFLTCVKGDYGGTRCEPDQPEIAETFSISLSSVEDWLRTYRTTGRLKPRPFTGGAKRALQAQAQVIVLAVKPQPGRTLAELCTVVATKTGVSPIPSMMCRELQLLNLPPKKLCTTDNANPRVQKLRAEHHAKTEATLRFSSNI